jgi:hypothetical protein
MTEALKGKINFARINGDLNKKSGNMLIEDGYPTIAFVEDGVKKGEFLGERTAVAIQAWVEDRIAGKAIPKKKPENFLTEANAKLGAALMNNNGGAAATTTAETTTTESTGATVTAEATPAVTTAESTPAVTAVETPAVTTSGTPEVTIAEANQSIENGAAMAEQAPAADEVSS